MINKWRLDVKNMKHYDLLKIILDELDLKGKKLGVFSNGNVVASISKKSHAEFLKIQN